MSHDDSRETTEGLDPEDNQADVEEHDSNDTDQINDPDVLRSQLREARDRMARYRVTARDHGERVTALEGQLTGIRQALGLESDDPDPAALTGELEKLRGELRQERLANRFTRIATSAHADAELTLAYLAHRGQLADLDPDADDFEQTLKSRIETAIQANPKLKADASPSRAGAEFGSGTSEGNVHDMNTLIRGAMPRPRS